ncbi:thiol:disulfide interchange protein DsbD [Arthrobacter sp. Hiyo4]|nr:thiol:disulfide interchange protein DsbD [Arthrobacter sp. Hiyo4]
MFAGTLGSLVSQHRGILVASGAGLVIALGVAQVAGIRMPSILRNNARTGSSRLSVFVLGAVYGIAGVCTGPILGSILTVAAVGGNALYGGILLAVYALGMALPLFALSLLWDRLGIPGRRWLRPPPVTIGRWSNSWVMIISGALSIGIGVLLLVTDGTAGLGGVLTVTDQFHVESAVSGAASGVPNTAFALLAAAILAVAAALYFRSQRNNGPAGSDAEAKSLPVKDKANQ